MRRSPRRRKFKRHHQLWLCSVFDDHSTPGLIASVTETNQFSRIQVVHGCVDW